MSKQRALAMGSNCAGRTPHTFISGWSARITLAKDARLFGCALPFVLPDRCGIGNHGTTGLAVDGTKYSVVGCEVHHTGCVGLQARSQTAALTKGAIRA